MSNTTRLDTILIIRHGGVANWEKTSYRLQKGELGIGYLPNGNVIVKSGVDGTVAWQDCPQVEGVLEKDLILTHDFGRHTIGKGFVNAGGKNMTVTQWLEDALYAPRDPKVTYPTASLTASFVPAFGEAGTKITQIVWDGTYTDGSYEFGSTGNNEENSVANTTATWVVKDTNGNQIGVVEDNAEGWNYNSQITDGTVGYTISASVICQPAEGCVPYNNVGEEVADKKITGFDETGKEVMEVSARAHVTGYRKPFWASLSTPLDLTKLTSSQVRGLGSSATKTKGLPISLPVSSGSRQVLFFAKAGVYNKLIAKDANAAGAEVFFDKTEKAVKVEGANGYEAIDYDMWSVTWDGPISSPKMLLLTWL